MPTACYINPLYTPIPLQTIRGGMSQHNAAFHSVYNVCKCKNDLQTKDKYNVNIRKS